MYAAGKENGGVVGRIGCDNDGLDLSLEDMAQSTGCEESLRCGVDGVEMTLSAALDPSSGDLAWIPEENEEAVASRILGTNQMPSKIIYTKIQCWW